MQKNMPKFTSSEDVVIYLKIREGSSNKEIKEYLSQLSQWQILPNSISEKYIEKLRQKIKILTKDNE